MADLSKQQLLAFLTWVGEKGLMKKNTAHTLRSACTNVLAVMDQAEERDLSGVDITSVIERYQNLHSLDVSPGTMRAYDKRVRYAISEFLKYSDDKGGWKPSGGYRAAPMAQPSSKSRDSNRKSDKGSVGKPTPPPKAVDVSDITHQFPLRRDVVVTIRGIPFDVRRSEMSRLNAFLSNLVAMSGEDQQPRLMLGAPEGETLD